MCSYYKIFLCLVMVVGVCLATTLSPIPLLRRCGKTFTILCRSPGFYSFTFQIAITIHQLPLSYLSYIPDVLPGYDDGGVYQDHSCDQLMMF